MKRDFDYSANINSPKSLDVIVLCKDNQFELNRTLKSIPRTTEKLRLKIKVFDGSINELDIKKHKEKFARKNIEVIYFNTEKISIKGIYQCMNYALSKVSGDWFIFMNSGDEFFSKSILENIEKYFFLDKNIKVLFGRAKIIGRRYWIVPPQNIRSIRLWLKFFMPNHQAMFVSSALSSVYKFNTNSPSNADQEWKFKLLNTFDFEYIPQNICNFYLGGISSSYNYNTIKLKLKEKKRSKISKIFEICKNSISILNFCNA